MVEPGGKNLFLLEIVFPVKAAAYSREFGYLLHVPNHVMSSTIILAILLLLTFLSGKRREVEFMDQGSSLVIRGIAIIFLLLGHLSALVLDRPVFFTAGGPLAVITFLFLSGFGIQKRYGLKTLKGEFWKKRMVRLTLPLWLSLILFFFLDYIVYRRAYTTAETVLPFLFINVSDHNWVNSSAWFVTFILFNYIVYFVSSRLKVNVGYKALFVFLVTIAVFALLSFREYRVTELWRQYLAVFPLGILLSIVLGRYRFDKNKYLENRLVLVTLLLGLGAVTYYVSNRNALLRPVSPILIIMLLSKLMVLTGYTSRFLAFLGRHSYEIFLLHLPFMMRFDLILYQWPIHISFIIYFAVIVALAVILSRASSYLNDFVLKGRWIPARLRKSDV